MSEQSTKLGLLDRFRAKLKPKGKDSTKPGTEVTLPSNQGPQSGEGATSLRSIENGKDVVSVSVGKMSLDESVEGDTEERMPRNLWENAFEKLGKSQKDILQQLKAATKNEQLSDATVVTAVIDQTKERYATYMKGGKISSRGEGKDEIDIRGKAYKILDSALSFQTLVADIAVFDPTGHASSAWAIMALGLNMIKNDHDLLNSIFDATGYLSGIIARYTSIAIDYRDRKFNDSERLEDAIIEVYVAILNYSAAVADAQNVNFAERVLKSITPLTGQPLTMLKSDINSRDEVVRKWTELIGHQYRKSEADEILNKIDENIKVTQRIEAKVLTAEEERILEWLYSGKISTRHLQSDKSRTDGTCQWLLKSDKYKTWLASPSVLWLYGVVGCGKTVLCSTVIKDLQHRCRNDPNAKLAYWYFQFDVSSSQSVYNMMRSFIRQLSSSPLLDTLTGLWKVHKTAGSDPGLDELTKVLDAVIDSIEGQVFLVLDALDECPFPADGPDVPDRKDLLVHICDLSEKHRKNLHILSTSRNETDIKKALGLYPSINIEEFVEGDVRTFVKGAIKSGDLNDYSDEIKDKIEERLISTNEIRFRWADLQIRRLGLCNNESQLLECLRTIPETLEATYKATLENIRAPNDKIARSILMWLTSSLRPPTLQEIAAAVSLKKPEYALRICSSMLVTLIHEDTDDVIKLAHFSVKEYLISIRPMIGKEEQVLWYRFTNKEAHAEIAQTTIQQLLETDNMDVSDRTMVERPLLSYSAKFWHQHVKAVEDDIANFSQLRQSIHDMFSQEYSKSYLNWLRLDDPDNESRPRFYKPLEEFPQPLYYASLLGFQDSVEKLLQEGANAMTTEGRHYAAFVAAAVHGHTQIVARLLDTYTEVEERHVRTVVRYIERNVRETIEVLLNKGIEDGQITREVVEALTSNSRCDEVIALFLGRADIQFTEGAIAAIARKFDDRMMALVLERRSAEVRITEEVVEAAFWNRSYGEKVIKLLLGHADVKVTGGAMPKIIRAFDDSVIGLLLRRSREVHITDELVKEVSRHRFTKEMMELLLGQADVQITEGAIAALAGESGWMMKLILERRIAEVRITEEVVEAAFWNKWYGIEVMKLLLGRADVQITEGAIVKIAGQPVWMMELLLKHRYVETQITEEVVKAAAGNEGFGVGMMKLLLDLRGEDVHITEGILKAAAKNRWTGVDIMELLLDRRGEDVQITEEVVKAIVRNERRAEGLLQLLQRYGKDFQITEGVVEAVISSDGDFQHVLWFLSYARDLRVTERAELLIAQLSAAAEALINEEPGK